MKKTAVALLICLTLAGNVYSYGEEEETLPRVFIDVHGGLWFPPLESNFSLNHKLSFNTAFEFGVRVLDVGINHIAVYLGGQFSPQTLTERAKGDTSYMISGYFGGRWFVGNGDFGFPYLGVAVGIISEQADEIPGIHYPPSAGDIEFINAGYEYIIRVFKIGVRLEGAFFEEGGDRTLQWLFPSMYIGLAF